MVVSPFGLRGGRVTKINCAECIHDCSPFLEQSRFRQGVFLAVTKTVSDENKSVNPMKK